MSVESFIRAMPKVNLHVQLEGAVQIDLLLMFAEQNNVVSTYKKQKEFKDWVALLQNPDYKKIDEIARETTAWARYHDDLARAIYELGLSLSKQNIHYAEVSILPAVYTDAGIGFQNFLDALNDGRDRVLRAWQVKMNWVFSMSRDMPRKSDDVVRWVTSTTAQKGNVVGIGLVGRENELPILPFKRAFNMAEKKDIPRITHAHSHPGADPLQETLETVEPQRLLDVWGLLEDEDALNLILAQNLPVVVCPTREIKLGRIKSYADYPYKELLGRGVNLLLAAEMPALFGTSLNDEYAAAAQHGGLSVQELQDMVERSVQAALLPGNEKQEMLTRFREEFISLSAEHLTEEAG